MENEKQRIHGIEIKPSDHWREQYHSTHAIHPDEAGEYPIRNFGQYAEVSSFRTFGGQHTGSEPNDFLYATAVEHRRQAQARGGL
jgi:hypothetical protein